MVLTKNSESVPALNLGTKVNIATPRYQAAFNRFSKNKTILHYCHWLQLFYLLIVAI